jgi:hypothetical protein
MYINTLFIPHFAGDIGGIENIGKHKEVKGPRSGGRDVDP